MSVGQREIVYEALKGSPPKYGTRSARGLSRQTGLHIEHVEGILIDLAKDCVVEIRYAGDRQYWVRLLEEEELLS